MKILILAFLLFTFAFAEAATIYVDNAGSMSGNCTTGNYSIASRNCTGSNGNAYTTPAAALTASAANDTVEVRAGTYVATMIFPKAGQTWTARSGETATMTTTAGLRVFQIESVNNATINGFTITGGQQNAIWIGSTTGSKVTNNTITQWGTVSAEYNHAVSLSDGAVNVEITGNTIYEPANPRLFNAGIGTGGSNSNVLIANNTVYGTGSFTLDMGIWSDVAACSPDLGRTPCTVRNNTVHDIETYCYHVEIGSTWNMYNNIGYNCHGFGMFIRPGGTGQGPAPGFNGLKVQNNTFWNVGNVGIGGTGGGIMVQRDSDQKMINSNIDNNIIASSNNLGSLLVVGDNSAADTSNTFKNNLLYASGNNFGVCWNKSVGSGTTCGSGTVYADSSAGISSWQTACGSTCVNNISGDPLFTNAGSNDFTLQSGSPAATAGLTIGGITTDFSGTSRTAPYSIGAYEFDAGGTPRNRAVTISSPLDGSTVPRRSNVTIEAEFDPDITSVTYAVNDKDLNCGELATACNWRVPSPPNRNYTISVMVEDAENNTGMDQVKVRSVR